MARTNGVSRRTLLKAGVLGSVTALAGCTQDDDAADATTSTSASENLVFRDVSFDGPYLIVRLREDHAVTKLNLIAPDGSLFTRTGVPEGVTRASLQLLDVGAGKHYIPGQHRLTAVTPGQDSASTSVDLVPELKIVNVRQYSSGRSTPGNRGNVVVRVENRGTGPTWIYNIAYENALYDAANSLDVSPNLPTANLALPKTAAETVLHPNESQEFMGSIPPFLITNSEACDGRSSKTVVIAQAAGNSTTRRLVRASYSGELLSANFQASCSEVSIEMLRREAENA